MSQPKYLEVDQTPVDERNSTHESRSWDKDIVDTPCSGNCLTLLFCLPCSLCCCLPHSLAAMARKIGWLGFAKRSVTSYQENKKMMNDIILGIIFIPIVMLFSFVLIVNSNHSYNYRQHLHDTGKYDYSNPLLLFHLILEAIYFALVMMLCIYIIMVRNTMRNKLKIKPICCNRFGDVGGAFEDVFCLTACAPCALEQMHAEADLYLELSCVGTDPGHLSANIV